MPRQSIHVEPVGGLATARHYVGDFVLGANDGIITTFAVVSGVAGGALAQAAILVVGAANLAADGVSMGVGNFQAIRASERAREADGLPEVEAHAWKHGVATLLAFVCGGALPLAPFAWPGDIPRLPCSALLTMGALFAVGAGRAALTRDTWWKTGLEALGWGGVVGVVAYVSGWLASGFVTR